MSSKNRQIKKHIGLIGAICGSLLLGMPAIAQTNSNPGNINSIPGSRGSSSDTQGRPSTTSGQTDRLSDAERDRLCANYVNETATNRPGNPTPRNMRQNESLGMNRDARSSANRVGATTGNTNETSRITQSLPTGRVNESPEVRDGRYRDRTSANAQEICASYMRERGMNRDMNRDTSSDRQGDSPSRDLRNTPPAPESGPPANDPGTLETDSSSDSPSNSGQRDR